MTEQTKPWASFGYEPVPGLMNRLIARYLRTQRKNMLRFFQERNMFALADRMNQIRKSRQPMLAKNRMFQEVLNDYSKLVNPATVSSVPGAVLHPATVSSVPGAVLHSPPVIAGETE